MFVFDFFQTPLGKKPDGRSQGVGIFGEVERETEKKREREREKGT